MPKITDRLNTIISGSTTPMLGTAIKSISKTKTPAMINPPKNEKVAVATNTGRDATEKAMNSAYKATKVFR